VREGFSGLGMGASMGESMFMESSVTLLGRGAGPDDAGVGVGVGVLCRPREMSETSRC
jgi:hypothetical protein